MNIVKIVKIIKNFKIVESCNTKRYNCSHLKKIENDNVEVLGEKLFDNFRLHHFVR